VTISQVKMITDDAVARLIIYAVTPDDAGAYSISVSNAFGQASGVINVNIAGKRRTRAQFGHQRLRCVIIVSNVDIVELTKRVCLCRHLYAFSARLTMLDRFIAKAHSVCPSVRLFVCLSVCLSHS